jgi:RNA polymerase sigma-70 factor (ECF subfamily)
MRSVTCEPEDDQPGFGVDDRPDGAADDWSSLFARIASGDTAALDALFDAAAHGIYGVALWHTRSPEDARDIVQDVFVRVAERRADLESVRSPKAWLYAVAHRMAVDLGRRRRIRNAEPLDEAGLVMAVGDDPERAADAAKATSHLGRLPAPQRDAVYLHLFAGCTFAEIAKAVGVPTFTAASRYRLGMRKLRRLMENDA